MEVVKGDGTLQNTCITSLKHNQKKIAPSIKETLCMLCMGCECDGKHTQIQSEKVKGQLTQSLFSLVDVLIIDPLGPFPTEMTCFGACCAECLISRRVAWRVGV